jgi:hypothetical protein
MHRLPISLVFAAAFAGAASAQETPNQETWLCNGVYQTAPGEQVKPQERKLTLYPGGGKAVMKIGAAEKQGRFEVSAQHVAAWFETPGSADERLLEEATLDRVTGRLSTHVQRKDGTRVGVYRGGCRPAGTMEDPEPPNAEDAGKS